MSNIYGYTTESVFAKFVSIDKTQTISGKKTFATLPESPEVPITANQLTNKAYVGSVISAATGSLVTTDTDQSITAVKTFTALPESSIVPTTADQLTNKAYVGSAISTAVGTLPARVTTLETKTTGIVSFNPTGSITTFEKTGVVQAQQLFSKKVYGWDSYINAESDLKLITIGYNIEIDARPAYPLPPALPSMTITPSSIDIQRPTTFAAVPKCSTAPTTVDDLANKAYVDGVASAISTVLVTDTNAAINYYPVFASTGTGQKSLLFDISSTPLSYLPSTGTLSCTYLGLPTTNPSTITGSGINVIFENNTEFGLYQFFVATSTTPYRIMEMSAYEFTNYTPSGFKKMLSFTGVDPGNRQINNTFYNLRDTTVVAGGAAQGRIYSDTGATYIEGFVGNHNIIGTENSSGTQRVLFDFGSTSADLYPLNIRLGSTNGFNIGIGAGSLSNLIIGFATPKTIVFTTGFNTFVGTGAGQNATIASASNTCFGNNSGNGLTSGIQNTFVGSAVGFQTANGSGSRNVCVGFQSGLAMTTSAANNTLIGTNAGAAITTGTNNTCVGYLAGDGITSGGNNVFIGQESGFRTLSLGTGNQNTCVGVVSGNAMTTSAAGNSIFGFDSGGALTTGTNNTILGQSAAPTLTTGSNNIVIGNGADILTAAAANVIAIGTSAETMFIQGGFNYRIGANITSTATGTLTAPLAQFYSVAMTAVSQSITLPAPSGANVKGACVTFKRKTNTTAFIITAGASSMMPVNLIAPANSISIGTTTYNVQLICDGVYWSVVQQS